jgi:pseudaminic acid synthase
MIGKSPSPYVIAEISGNHNGDLDRAKALVSVAAEAGADCVKLQTYTAASMTLDSDKDDFRISGGLWDGRTLWDLYEEAHTPLAWHGPLFEHAKSLGIDCISTPFDEAAVDFLEALACPFYKIASFELLDLPLIGKVARTGKPMIMSTGLASIVEIEQAVAHAEANGARDLYLLHCVSGYPTPIEDINLAAIKTLQDKFGDHIGLSDHSLGTMAAIMATALGARVIEKHITLARADGGPDAAFSLEPQELRDLVAQCRQSAKALGDGSVSCTSAEAANLKFRRSIYASRDIRAGETFTPDNIKRIRPGFGLAPRYFETLIGRTCQKDIAFGDPLAFDHTDINETFGAQK